MESSAPHTDTTAALRPSLSVLRSFVADHALEANRLSNEHDVDRRFRQIFDERRRKAEMSEPSLRHVPRFHWGGAAAQDDLSREMQKLARTQFLRRRSLELLDTEDLSKLALLLSQYASPPFQEGDAAEKINYDAYSDIGSCMPAKARAFFTADTFLKFRRDRYGRIDNQAFFQYVLRKVTLAQTRIQLSLYDSTGDGFLREQDLENYIYELIPQLPALSELEENFYPFYVFTATRKFFFFLDPKRRGKIAIKDMLCSGLNILDELHELKAEDWEEDEGGGGGGANWFSSRNALRVYSDYLELDEDHNGMLSKSELISYGNGTLTHVFVNRVFQECHTYEGEMDYKTFLDFVLAMENKPDAPALQYFWRLLDFNKCGYLDIFAINYFFREVVTRMREAGHEPVNVEDVKDEIFDMVKPENPARITFKDLLDCGVGHTIVLMLTDVNGFWAYDNRENLLADDEDAEDDDPSAPPPPMAAGGGWEGGGGGGGGGHPDGAAGGGGGGGGGAGAEDAPLHEQHEQS
eukprot:g1881.t1